MDYAELVQRRKSARNYKDKAIPPAEMEAIRAFLPQCHRLCPDIHWEARFLDAGACDALSGVAGYKGFMISAPAYILLLSDKADHFIENAGFIGEDIVLKLTELGLASCWVTFGSGDAVKAALHIDTDRQASAIIAFGYAESAPKSVRLDFKTLSDVDVKQSDAYSAPKVGVEDMVHIERWGRRSHAFELADSPLWPALYAASRAPSYLNRQPVQLIVDGGQVVLVVRRAEDVACLDERLNAGIVMLHFAVMRLDRHPDFHWTLGAPKKDYALPKGYVALAVCTV